MSPARLPALMSLEPQYAHLLSSLVAANYVPPHQRRAINSLRRRRGTRLPGRGGTGLTARAARRQRAIQPARGAWPWPCGGHFPAARDAMAGAGPAGAPVAPPEGALPASRADSQRGARHGESMNQRRARIEWRCSRARSRGRHGRSCIPGRAWREPASTQPARACASGDGCWELDSWPSSPTDPNKVGTPPAEPRARPDGGRRDRPLGRDGARALPALQACRSALRQRIPGRPSSSRPPWRGPAQWDLATGLSRQRHCRPQASRPGRRRAPRSAFLVPGSLGRPTPIAPARLWPTRPCRPRGVRLPAAKADAGCSAVRVRRPRPRVSRHRLARAPCPCKCTALQGRPLRRTRRQTRHTSLGAPGEAL